MIHYDFTIQRAVTTYDLQGKCLVLTISLASGDSHLLWTWKRSDSQNQTCYSDSSNGTTCIHLSFPRNPAALASP